MALPAVRYADARGRNTGDLGTGAAKETVAHAGRSAIVRTGEPQMGSSHVAVGDSATNLQGRIDGRRKLGKPVQAVPDRHQTGLVGQSMRAWDDFEAHLCAHWVSWRNFLLCLKIRHLQTATCSIAGSVHGIRLISIPIKIIELVDVGNK